MSNTTIPELTELATLLARRDAHVVVRLAGREWEATIYTRPIDHEHVTISTVDSAEGSWDYGTIEATSPNLHTAINLAAARARLVLASIEEVAA